MKSWPFKDPGEVLDYGFDWSPRDLGGETLLGSTATVVSGSVVKDSHAVTGDALTTTWLSGGAAGEACEILLVAQTATRTFRQTVSIAIRDRG